jgi:hypothetical protein
VEWRRIELILLDDSFFFHTRLVVAWSARERERGNVGRAAGLNRVFSAIGLFAHHQVFASI